MEPLAKDIVSRARGWQVWSIERRENLLEDQSVVDQAKRGEATPQRSSTTTSAASRTRTSRTTSSSCRTSTCCSRADGACSVAVEDLRQVVKLARRQADEVVLGGHSLGGSITTAYATWDFDGQPGRRRPRRPRLHRRRQRPATLTAEQADDGAAEPEQRLAVAGVRRHRRRRSPGSSTSSARRSPRSTPNAPSILQDVPVVPPNLKAPVRVDERGAATATRSTPRPRRRTWSPRRCTRAISPRAAIRAAGTRGRRAQPDPARRRHVLRHRATGPRRDRLVPPDATDDRLGGGRRRESRTRPRACSTSRRCTAPTCRASRSTRSAPRSAGSAFWTRRSCSRRSPASRSSKVTLVNDSATYAHVDPIAAYPQNDFVTNLLPFLKQVKGQRAPAR